MLALSLACSPRPRASGPPPASATIATSEWRYEVVPHRGGADLDVHATFPRGSGADLSVEEGAEPFVRDVAVANGESWQDVASRDGATWVVPACSSAGCQVRYRFALSDAARALADMDTAIARDGAFLAPPSTWLLRPLSTPSSPDDRFRLHVAAGATDTAFVSGLTPVVPGGSTYGARITDLPIAPYSAFGRMRQHTLRLDDTGRTLAVAFAGPELAVGDAALLRWMAHKASVVADYYGGFPVFRALVLVLGTGGERFDFGKTLGNGGASILLPMGHGTSAASLADDWVLVHEMMHVGFPSLGRQHAWLEEGMATYVEPIARARAGDLRIEEVWRGLLEGLPQGLPRPGDAGLEQTHTWGRTYWGGALFCLLADIAIREQTHNVRSLGDAIRGVVAAGGTVADRWEIARVIAVGDAATGTAVLADLYGKMSRDPYPVDLEALWKRLGIRRNGRQVLFDDAPLAYVRRAITAR